MTDARFQLSFKAALLVGAAFLVPGCAPAAAPAIAPAEGALTVKVAWPAATRKLMARADDVDRLSISASGGSGSGATFYGAEILTAGMLKSGVDGHTFTGLPAGTYQVRVSAFVGAVVIGETQVAGVAVVAGGVTALPVAVHLMPALPAFGSPAPGAEAPAPPLASAPAP